MSDQQPKGKGSKDSKKEDRVQYQTKNQRVKEVRTQGDTAQCPISNQTIKEVRTPRKEIEHNVRPATKG